MTSSPADDGRVHREARLFAAALETGGTVAFLVAMGYVLAAIIRVCCPP